MWVPQREATGCPHKECTQVQRGTIRHVFWDCPKAQVLWNEVHSCWTALGVTFGDHAGLHVAVETPRLPMAPKRLVTDPTVAAQYTRDPDQIVSIPQHIWIQHVLATINSIWRWRVTTIYSTSSEAHEWTCLNRLELKRACQDEWRAHDLRINSKSASRILLPALHRLMRGRVEEKSTIRTPMGPGTHILLFDSGSRGNQASGGSGAVIIYASSRPPASHIIWAGSRSLANKLTTNNVAEFTGPITGLEAAQRLGLRDITVIGDSPLILGWMRGFRPTGQPLLKQLYIRARHISAPIRVRHWIHHYRHHDKMADFLANQTMDAKSSAESLLPTRNKQLIQVAQHLSNDADQWILERLQGL